jgi:hypothetical protein
MWDTLRFGKEPAPGPFLDQGGIKGDFHRWQMTPRRRDKRSNIVTESIGMYNLADIKEVKK